MRGTAGSKHVMIGLAIIAALILVFCWSPSAEAKPHEISLTIDAPDAVNVCEPSSYIFHVNNTGDQPLNNLTANVTMPADFEYMKGSAVVNYSGGNITQEPSIQGRNLSWDLSSVVNPLAVNATVSIRFNLTARCDAASDVQLTAAAISDETTATATSSSILVNRGLILLEKLPQSQDASIGDIVNFTVNVTNVGTGPLFNVTVNDTLGDGLSLISTNASDWPEWRYSRIEVDETRTVNVSAEVDSCQGLYNDVYATWGCNGQICHTTYAQASIKLIYREPQLTYTVEPSPISLPYCGSTRVYINMTNTGDGGAHDIYLAMEGMPAAYPVSDVTNATYYPGNTTLYVGTLQPHSAKNISFNMTVPYGTCNGPTGGSITFNPRYKDECDNTWAPPVNYISYTRETGPSISASKTGPDRVRHGENITYTITATYNKNECSLDSVTTNITDTYPDGFTIQDAAGGTINATNNTITWKNVTLTDGTPWTANVSFTNEHTCGDIVTNTVNVEETLDCCGCPMDGSATASTASVCDENYTGEEPFTWNKEASHYLRENSNNISYYNNMTFHLEEASWSDIWFREQGNNGQTAPNGSTTVNATFVINGTLSTTRNITLNSYTSLDFLAGLAPLANGTNLTISYSLHQWNTGTFFAWSDVNITGHPNPASDDNAYHQGQWITVERAAYGIDIDIPSIVNSCGIYQASINLNHGSDWDAHDMVIVLNGTNYRYVNGTATITGLQYNSSSGSYQPVPTFEPTRNGTRYIWNLSSYGEIRSDGTITFNVSKSCDLTKPIGASLTYRDNCENEYNSTASDEPRLITTGDICISKFPEEQFAYTRELSWRICVPNKGNGTAYNLTVSDMMGEDLSYVNSTIDGEWDPANTTVGPNGRNITWAIGNATPNQKVVIEITANLTGCENLSNDVTASWGCIYGETCQEVHDSAIVSLETGQILVTKHDIDDIDPCGDEAQGTITIKNGGVDTYDVNVTEQLPANLTYIPGTAAVTGATPSSFTQSENNLTWHFDTLPRGTEVTITFNVTTISPCATFPDPASATVNYTLPCTAYGAEDTETIEIEKTSPHLSITKQPAMTIAEPGDAVNWTITVTSDGDYEAKNITVQDRMPANVAYLNSTIDDVWDPDNTTIAGQNITWHLSNMTVGEIHYVNITVNVTGCTVNDTNNTATVTWGCCPYTMETSTDTANLRTSPRINVTQTHGDIIPCGGNFTITIHNNGSRANVTTIEDTIPVGYLYKTGSATITSSNSSRSFADSEPTDYSSSNRTIVWDQSNIDYIHYNETITIYFEITDNGTGCDEDIPSFNNITFHYTNPCGHTFTTNSSQPIDPLYPELTVTKTPFTQVVNQEGDTATWQISISNTGDTAARNISIVDILGSAYRNSSIVVTEYGAIDFDAKIENNVISWSNQTITTTETWERTINATMAAGGGGNNTLWVNGTCDSGCQYTSVNLTTYTARHNITKFPDMERTIGEYANFTINATFWGNGEQYVNATINDTLPSGLNYVTSSATDDKGNSYEANLTTISAGDDTIYSWYIGNFTGPRNITINVTTTVADVATNQNGTYLTNNATMHHQDAWENDYTSHNDSTVLIREPDLSIEKQAGTAVVQAGDTVTYTIWVNQTAASTWPAYDVWVNDTIPDGLTYVAESASASPVADGFVQSGQQLAWYYEERPNGSTAMLSYDVTVDSDVVASQPLVNRANVTWTSINGSDPDERYGGWTSLDDYNGTDAAPVDVSNAVTIDKTPDGQRLRTIGEDVAYTITIDLPRATLYEVWVNDSLPDGLSYNPGSFTLTANNASFSESVGDSISWYLGTVNNSDDTDVTISFNATVADVAVNQDGDVLSNDATVEWQDFAGVMGSESDAAGDVLIREPDLSIGKVANRSVVEAGDVVNYSITVQHTAASSWPAYDVWINDTIPEGLTYVSNASVPGADGAVQDGQQLAWYYEELPEGDAVTINYTVTVDDDVVVGQDLDNAVDLTWTSMNGSDPDERFGNYTALDDYNRSAAAPLDVNNTAIVTKAPEEQRNYTVGETVNFTIQVDLPNATAYNVWINDTLPAGFIYYSSSFAMTANNDSFAEYVSSPNDGSAPVSVNWSLGTVNNTDDTDIFIAFNVTVADVMSNQNGTVLNNTAALAWTDDDGGLRTDVDTSGDVQLLEPDLSVGKSVNRSAIQRLASGHYSPQGGGAPPREGYFPSHRWHHRGRPGAPRRGARTGHGWRSPRRRSRPGRVVRGCRRPRRGTSPGHVRTGRRRPSRR